MEHVTETCTLFKACSESLKKSSRFKERDSSRQMASNKLYLCSSGTPGGDAAQVQLRHFNSMKQQQRRSPISAGAANSFPSTIHTSTSEQISSQSRN